MKSHFKLFSFFVVAAGFAGATLNLAGAPEGKPKYTVSDVMKAVHKGEDNIGKRIAKGTASKEDIARMLEHYESLPLNEPPKGDKQAWAAKTKKLLSAARALEKGEPGAMDQFKAAANCKACHEAHRPE